MQDIRYLDKLVDELAKGKAMEKIKRTPKNNTYLHSSFRKWYNNYNPIKKEGWKTNEKTT